jgi:hypothetical protein
VRALPEIGMAAPPTWATIAAVMDEYHREH